MRVPIPIRAQTMRLLERPILHKLSKRAYAGVTQRLVERLSRVPGVETVGIRGGAVDRIVPGGSDIDLFVVISSRGTESLPVLETLRRTWRSLRAHFLIPGELVVLDAARICALTVTGTPLMETFRSAKSLWGRPISFPAGLNPFARISLAYEYFSKHCVAARSNQSAVEAPYWHYLAIKFLSKSASLLGVSSTRESVRMALIEKLPLVKMGPVHSELRLFGPVSVPEMTPERFRAEIFPDIEKSDELYPYYFGLYGCKPLITRIEEIPRGGFSDKEISKISVWATRALKESIDYYAVAFPTLFVNETPDLLRAHEERFYLSVMAHGAKLLCNHPRLATVLTSGGGALRVPGFEALLAMADARVENSSPEPDYGPSLILH